MICSRKSALPVRWVLIGILIFYLGLTSAHRSNAQQAGDSLVITGDNLRLRSQPSTDSDIIATLSVDTTATVVDPGDGTEWVAIRLPDGEMGWVHKDYVAIVEHQASNESDVWFGDFAFAAVSRPDDEFVLHGHFDEGLPVRLVHQDGNGYMEFVTTSQGHYASGGSDIEFPFTRISGDVELSENATIPFAIVGNIPSYSVMPLRPWHYGYGMYEAMADLRKQLDQPTMFTEIPDAYRFGPSDQSGVLVAYAGVAYTYDDTPTLMKRYLVIVEDRSYMADVGCGRVPLVFTIGDEYFLFGHYQGCESGDVGQFVIRLTPEAGRWSNFDYSM